MNCPLCGKELEATRGLDPKTGIDFEKFVCPTMIRLIRTYSDVCHFYDLNHYQKMNPPPQVPDIEHCEIAYVLPYRIHNLFDSNYCEVSDASDSPDHPLTRVIFKSPIIPFTNADALRQRIKNLVAFS